MRSARSGKRNAERHKDDVRAERERHQGACGQELSWISGHDLKLVGSDESDIGRLPMPRADAGVPG